MDISQLKEKPENRFYDNSMLEVFRRCHRQFYLRHVRDWTPEITSHNLIFGLCWHSAQDVIWHGASSAQTDVELLDAAFAEFMVEWNKSYPGYSESAFVDSTNEELFPKTPARALEMLSWYIKVKRPHIAKWRILGIELPFVVPIPGDDYLYYIGRNDKVVEKEDGRIYVVDHKTTKTDSQVWKDTFFPNNQIDGYNYASLLTYGEKYWGVEIDGALCQKGSPRTWKNPNFPPGIGFPSHAIMAATGHTQSWLWETTYTIRLLESHIDMLKDCKPDDEILRAFDKRTTACGYYSGCIYRNVCAYVVNPARMEEPPTGFKVEKWEPFSIEEPKE